ncbi:PAS domain S-box protein [Thermanaerosceptrum fracticalcis]|uniref:PAS domain S-box protein n=1 Tax=Thermanaerosceptrum fracticalcis TaxID=1712410 RepID=A0A7G6E6A5_THEFR|nr:sigma 54-interacting transcriptional regulator [Thermanaerosceptrum fracticalcis]QNB47609.1 PAS domain S-box protein [Thermanaerosceptrum fracticalcis]
MKRICLIAPYKELAELAWQAKQELNLAIDIKEGNLEEGIAPALEAQRRGAQVIISRGGTASIIRKQVDVPVVEINVTGYDILKTLHQYRDSTTTIGIVGYQNVVYGCQTIASILNIPIQEIIIPNDDGNINWSEIKEQMTELVERNGIKVIVGDTTAASKLGGLNVDVHLITSGKEAIIQAIEESCHIIRVREQEEEKAKKFQIVLDFVRDAVIATDEKGLITVVNPMAEKIFNIKRENAYGQPIQEIVKNTGINRVLESGIAEIEQLQEVPVGHILTNRIPIKVSGQIKGVVATFQEISKIQDAEQKIRQNLYAKGWITKYKFNDILSRDLRMKRLIEIARVYAKTDATILIEGESGTGKEMLAQSIHAESLRSDGPFVAVNCAALPPQLLESELFGYEEGAFTGAKKGGKIGLFELAHNGTIFLDEIGEMDKGLQARLLRILEEKQVMRLGSDKIIPVNIRVIAATNVSLKNEISQGNFRMDLYYRLNVLNLRTIPLRERHGDIELLAHYFLRQGNQKYGRTVKKLAPEVIEFLSNYRWPGNLRELKNVIERIVLSAEKEYVTLADIELIVEELQNIDKNTQEYQWGHLLDGTLQEIKRKIILKVLEDEGYNKSRAARRLGIDRSTIERFL